MRNVLKKQECTEYILQIIMEKKKLEVLEQVIQKDYKNLQGRSAILDCVARDGEGNQYNKEAKAYSERLDYTEALKIDSKGRSGQP